jgi:hypothetical protein
MIARRRLTEAGWLALVMLGILVGEFGPNLPDQIGA